ncbi:MAG: alcohol dehydrogenase [Elusimicrobia bacterium]|nr:MAG: alcohol dehydrogenase [Elusimicrobiota bacterium]
MKALLYQGPQNIQLHEIPVPAIGDGEILVCVEACGLCGSDLVKIDANLRDRSVHLGHELAGRVHAVGDGVTKFKKGDRLIVSHHVPCLDCHYCERGNESMCREFKRTNLDPGGFAEYVRISANHVKHVAFKLPARVPFTHATMIEPLACVLRNIRRINSQEGDTVVVVGMGFIGLLTSLALKRIGVTVIGLDIDHIRVRLANKLGIDHAYTGKDGGGIPRLISQLTFNRGADALISTAGPSSLIAPRLEWIRDGGIMNIFAGYTSLPKANINLDTVYHRELTLLSSYSPQVQDLEEAHRIIVKEEIDVSLFARDTFGLEEFDEALRQVRGREIVKAILLPGKGAAQSKRSLGKKRRKSTVKR